MAVSVLPACGGGGGGGGGSSSGTAGVSGPYGNGSTPPPPADGSTSAGQTTHLSCDGFPQSVVVAFNGKSQTFTKVCLITQEYAAVTPDVSVSTKLGNVTTHGGPAADTYVVYSRIVAQAADGGTATALAKSVVVTTANSTISATPDQVDYPQSLEVDFEIFTATTTNLTVKNDAGNLAADNYNAMLHLTGSLGDVSLENVQGQVTVDATAGNIGVKLAGAAWTGAGLTATTKTGNVTLSHPATYAATFTAQTGLGTASVDGKSETTFIPTTPATVTAGSGAPVVLKTAIGNVTVAPEK